MKQSLQQLSLAAGMLVAMVMGTSVLVPAADAACDKESSAADCARTGAGSAKTGGETNIGDAIQGVVNALLFALGAAAVIMIVIGGFKFVTANGNAETIKSAKNTILYAVIGLIVALMAYAIVNFIVRSFTT